jgi:hypothetical protein
MYLHYALQKDNCFHPTPAIEELTQGNLLNAPSKGTFSRSGLEILYSSI